MSHWSFTSLVLCPFYAPVAATYGPLALGVSLFCLRTLAGCILKRAITPKIYPRNIQGVAMKTAWLPIVCRWLLPGTTSLTLAVVCTSGVLGQGLAEGLLGTAEGVPAQGTSEAADAVPSAAT